MQRRKFVLLAGGVIVIAGVTYYLLSDKTNFVRSDAGKSSSNNDTKLLPDEQSILYLASLAPSGHNTQPWAVKYLEPFHWIIANDKTKWLNAVDPTQRETILSIGAFLQNLEYAANNLGYDCHFEVLAMHNQDENIVAVKLVKVSTAIAYNIDKIKQRRTVRSNYLKDPLKTDDVTNLLNGETDSIHYISNQSKEHEWLNAQTIEANKIQAARDDAQKELGNWIRFSSEDAAQHADGLTVASMEIDGIPAWVLRNFYSKKEVMKTKFREESVQKVIKQVGQSGGWFIITSKDDSVMSLLETGKRMQRLFLNVRERSIALHPMTQIIEEASTNGILNNGIGINDPIQFILRTGYLKNYPSPVSLRRPVEQFVRS